MGLGTYSLQVRRRGCCPEHAPAANEMSDIGYSPTSGVGVVGAYV